MTNYQKIKAILETGTCYVGVELEYGNKQIYSSIRNSGNLRSSSLGGDFNQCYDTLGGIWYDEEEISTHLITKITPLPISHKEIKGLVDIVDCPDIRLLAKRMDLGSKMIEMIGENGLEIKEYIDDCYGQFYRIYQKDKNDYWIFPARFVIPHLGDEDKEIIPTVDELETIRLLREKQIKVEKV